MILEVDWLRRDFRYFGQLFKGLGLRRLGLWPNNNISILLGI